MTKDDHIEKLFRKMINSQVGMPPKTESRLLWQREDGTFLNRNTQLAFEDFKAGFNAGCAYQKHIADD